jgi:hypothetical protein
MNATFVAELLVGGVLTVTWLALAVMTMAGAAPVLNFLGTNPLGSTAIVGVYAYALGVIMDRLWDRLTKPLDHRIREKFLAAEDSSEAEYQSIRGPILASKEQREFFDYIRSRIRITRSCLCSFPLIGMTGVIACYVQSGENRVAYVAAATVFSLVMCSISWVAYVDVSTTYYKEMLKMGSRRQAGYGSSPTV